MSELSELIDECDKKINKTDVGCIGGILCYKKTEALHNYIDVQAYFKNALGNLDPETKKKEILEYLKITLENQSFDSRTGLWIEAIPEIYGESFIPYLVEMLNIENPKIPYYPILDFITYMPEETGELAVDGLCSAILMNNPYWSFGDFQSAFQALVFYRKRKGL